jgi:serine/threonine protein kinase
MDESQTIIAGSGDELPPGMPADPRVSYNPTRLTFDDLDLEPARGTVTEMDVAEAGRESGITVTEKVTHGYELRRIIGRGGFGEVWEGIQHSLHRVIAIKRVREDIYTIAKEHSRSNSFCEQGFRQEALTTGALDHPNIVPVYDFGLDENGRPLLAMKLVRGKPWDQIIWDDYNDPTQEFLNKHLQILVSVAQAVAFAHSRGVVHRDIKPSQVMVGEFGEVVLMDWGLALIYDQDLAKKQETSLSSGVVPTCDSAPNPAGTIAFMAPEQTQSTSVNIGPHTDVYLLGGVLYFLLTRTPPHAAPDSKAAFIEARSGTVELPRDRTPEREIPEELESLCMRALESDISRRIQTAKELIEGIKAYQTGAGKRRESMMLVQEAREIIEAKRPNYRELARGLSAIERAAGFWPDNPDIDDIREQLHVLYSQLALRNRDLVLATAQVERISTTTKRRALMKEIGKRRLYLASLRWTARVFMVGTIVLLGLVSVMAWRLGYRADEAHKLREAAERGESAAIESRRQAEELVNFLVDDLYESLERLGRLDLIDRVANEANQYYATLSGEGHSEEMGEVLRRARALRVLGDVQSKDRTLMLSEPMRAYRESLRLTEDLERNHPGQIDVVDALASSRFRVGRILVWTGDVEKGLDELHTSEKLHKEVVSRDPTRTRALLQATESVLLRAETMTFMGQEEFAESLLRDVAGLLRTLEGYESTRPEARRLRARMAIQAADEAARQGLMEDARGQLERARADLRLLTFDNSYDLYRRVETARADAIEAFIEMHQGDPQVARAKNLAAIGEIESIIGFSPRNAEWQRHLAEAYIYQAYIEIGLSGGIEAGIEWVSRAAVISRDTAIQDPSNVISQSWLAVTHGIVGTLMQEYDQDQLAMQELDQAIQILDELSAKAPAVAYWPLRKAQYQTVWARALRDLGAHDQAARMMGALIGEVGSREIADRTGKQLVLANARALRGQCLLQLGREEEGRRELESALEGASQLVKERAPNRYHAMRTQATAMILLGRNDEAAEVVGQLREQGFVGRELGGVIMMNSEL